MDVVFADEMAGLREFHDFARMGGGLDLWVKSYNEERPHQGRWCFGKTPLQTFLDAILVAREKMIAAWPSAVTGHLQKG